MNIVVQRRDELSDSNYILHPERARAYWANISGGRLNEYLGRCGEAFNIVAHSAGVRIRAINTERVTALTMVSENCR